jgi:hypothetical protein
VCETPQPKTTISLNEERPVIVDDLTDYFQRYSWHLWRFIAFLSISSKEGGIYGSKSTLHVGAKRCDCDEVEEKKKKVARRRPGYFNERAGLSTASRRGEQAILILDGC